MTQPAFLPEVCPQVERDDQGRTLVLLSEEDIDAVVRRVPLNDDISAEPPEGSDDILDVELQYAIKRASGMCVGTDRFTALIVIPFGLTRLALYGSAETWPLKMPVPDPVALARDLALAFGMPEGVQLTVLSHMTPLFSPVALPGIQGLNTQGLLDTQGLFSFAATQVNDLYQCDRLAVAHRQLLLRVDIPRGAPRLLEQVQRCVTYNASERCLESVLHTLVNATWMKGRVNFHAHPDIETLPEDFHAIEQMDVLLFGFARELNDNVHRLLLEYHLNALMLAASAELEVSLHQLEMDIHIGQPSDPKRAANDSHDIRMYAGADGRRSKYKLHWDASTRALELTDMLLRLVRSLCKRQVAGISVIDDGMPPWLLQHLQKYTFLKIVTAPAPTHRLQ